jgi:hypothetical protein
MYDAEFECVLHERRHADDEIRQMHERNRILGASRKRTSDLNVDDNRESGVKCARAGASPHADVEPLEISAKEVTRLEMNSTKTTTIEIDKFVHHNNLPIECEDEGA